MENDNKTTGIVRSIVILVSVFALAAAAIVCTFILTRGFVEAKSSNRGGLSATGSASLDFEAGEVKRAPKWMSDHGLEWIYRIFQDPKRLAKRYLVDDRKIFKLAIKYKKANR